MNPTNDFQSTASIHSLRQRARLLSQIRKFFDEREFFEVETPILSADVVVDRHIEPISIPGDAVGNYNLTDDSVLWLQTSPEFAMKRLLASGAEAIYQTTKAFRKSERGDQHNPEFTMLEWYRTGDDYAAGRQLLADFAKTILNCPTVDQVTYQNAFIEQLGICPLTAKRSELLKIVRQQTSYLSDDDDDLDRDELLNILLSERVEPSLGRKIPVIVYDFPATQAALARVRQSEPPVAERFELYFRGTELANGYHELLDPEELVDRNVATNRLRSDDGGQPLPVESRLLSSMRAGLPACCGCAVGVDRLAMILQNAEKIDEVIPFPIERA